MPLVPVQVLTDASLRANSLWYFLGKTLDPDSSVTLERAISALQQMQSSQVWGCSQSGQGCGH